MEVLSDGRAVRLPREVDEPWLSGAPYGMPFGKTLDRPPRIGEPRGNLSNSESGFS